MLCRAQNSGWLGILLQPELTTLSGPSGTVTNCTLPMHRREKQLENKDTDLMLSTDCLKFQV